MNHSEAFEFALKKLVPLLHDRIKEEFPDTFDICHALGEDHEKANPCMYSWYGIASNSILELRRNTPYSKTTKESDYSYLETMYTDLEKTNNVTAWMFSNINISGYKL